MNQALIVTVAVLAFLVLAFFCMRSSAPVIEARIEAQAVEQFAQSGIDWAEPVADGRNVTIRGTAPTPDARIQAAQVIAGIDGLRTIDNELQLPDEVFSPVKEIVAYETRMTVSARFVRYTGFVPDRESSEILMQRTRKLFPSRRVENELVVTQGAPDNWMDVMNTLLQRFSTYASAEAVISGNRIDVIASLAPGRDGEAQLLAAGLPSSYTSRINLSVALSESVEMCQRRLDDMMQTTINFEVASERIRADSYDLLNQLAERIRNCGGLRIEVSGHTDSEGLAMKNLELSQRRAEAVASYLVGKGIDSDQLVPWGYGESRPIQDNATSSGRAANRRIEFRALN